MKKVLLTACAGLCVMFMATSSGSGKSNKNNRISQVISQSDWKYYGDSTKPDSPKLAMSFILSDTTKDSTKVSKLVALISDTTKDTIAGPKYDLAYNGR